MTELFIFAFYLSVSTLLLIVVPVGLHPSLPLRRKLLIIFISFMLIVPGVLILYGLLGAPQMATIKASSTGETN